MYAPLIKFFLFFSTFILQRIFLKNSLQQKAIPRKYKKIKKIKREEFGLFIYFFNPNKRIKKPLKNESEMKFQYELALDFFHHFYFSSLLLFVLPPRRFILFIES